jgi:hypothetical protein
MNKLYNHRKIQNYKRIKNSESQASLFHKRYSRRNNMHLDLYISYITYGSKEGD